VGNPATGRSGIHRIIVLVTFEAFSRRYLVGGGWENKGLVRRRGWKKQRDGRAVEVFCGFTGLGVREGGEGRRKSNHDGWDVGGASFGRESLRWKSVLTGTKHWWATMLQP
jgi:hypothetical protein